MSSDGTPRRPARASSAKPNGAKAASASRSADSRARKARTPQGEETRNQILTAASSLFAANGYHATTVPDIVNHAGVGHGTFYEYFKSRRDVLVALTDKAQHAVTERPKARSNHLADRLRTTIYWYLLNLVEHLELTKIWHEAATFDPEIATTVREAQLQRVAHLRGCFEDLDPRPQLDAEVAASAVTAMIDEFSYRWFVDGQGPGTDTAVVIAAAETLCAMALAALGVESIAVADPSRPA